ncbi:MAG: 6-phosphogluconolactonase [Mariprofundaceae bacterium]
MNIVRFADAEALARAVAEQVAVAAKAAMVERGTFHLVLAGGSTPKRCYELMREMDMPWQAMHIWFGDERCLPPGDAERNDTMAGQALLMHVPLPAAHIHRMPAELGPDAGAASYAKELEHAPAMDLVLLGMGEDGHTASLFPGNPALTDARPAVPVFDSPKPPPERISMGLGLLNDAHRRIVMVAGEGKRAAWNRIQSGEALPAALLKQPEWYTSLS